MSEELVEIMARAAADEAGFEWGTDTRTQEEAENIMRAVLTALSEAGYVVVREIPADTLDLARAITEFEKRLPDWWWTTGACDISRDASCGPLSSGADKDLLKIRQFDEGFHHDGDGTVADSLRLVMQDAIDCRALVRGASAPLSKKEGLK